MDREILIDDVRGIGTAVKTLYFPPTHEALHRDIETLANKQPTINRLGELAMFNDFSLEIEKTDLSQYERLRQLTFLMQFTDHNINNRFSFDYRRVHLLWSLIVETGKECPLGPAEQFKIARNINEGSTINSLQYLMITYRLYARWLDISSMTNSRLMPDSKEDKIRSSLELRESTKAIKEPYTTQDTLGDTYYLWTHAYAQYLFGHGPSGKKLMSRIARNVFRQGTNIMHVGVHKLKEQSVPNNHRQAAILGNSIGSIILNKQSDPDV